MLFYCVGKIPLHQQAYLVFILRNPKDCVGVWSRWIRGNKYLLAARQMPKKSSIVISSCTVSCLTENYPKMNLPASTATENNCYYSHHDVCGGG